MSTAAACVLDGRPAYASLRTTDVDQARGFCSDSFTYPLRVRIIGAETELAFAADFVRVGPFTVGDITYGVDTRVSTGDLEVAYHLIAPVTGTVQTTQCDIEMPAGPGRAAVFGPVGEVEIAWSGFCRAFSVRVDRAALEREFAAVHGRSGESPLALCRGLDTADGPGRNWLALLRQMHHELHDPLSPARQPPMAHRWWQLVLSTLAFSIGDGEAAADAVRTLRPRTVKRTLDAMHADPARPFTVADLADIAGVGTRVLQQAFRVHVGMSPLAYLRELRLSKAYDDLCRADPRAVGVADIATRWGFTHLGRFAGAYRARFGVHPSVTLRDRP